MKGIKAKPHSILDCLNASTNSQSQSIHAKRGWPCSSFIFAQPVPVL